MKQKLKKMIALLVVLSTISSATPAVAAFGPTNNTPDAVCVYAGEVTVTEEIDPDPEEGNQLIITLPDADLSDVSTVWGDIYSQNERLFITSICVDDIAKTVKFTFVNPLMEGETLTFSIHGVSSPAGTHPYVVELYSGASDTTVELESGTYDVLDNGVTIKLTVGNFLHFGLDMNTSDPMDVKLQYIDGRAVVEHRLPWYIATNAVAYTVSARLKTELKNGEVFFPYEVPDGMGEYIPVEDMEYVTGVFVGDLAPNSRATAALIGHFTPITATTDVVLTTGGMTTMDRDEAKILFAADGKTPPGTYTGVLELTVTPTF